MTTLVNKHTYSIDLGNPSGQCRLLTSIMPFFCTKQSKNPGRLCYRPYRPRFVGPHRSPKSPFGPSMLHYMGLHCSPLILHTCTIGAWLGAQCWSFTFYIIFLTREDRFQNMTGSLSHKPSCNRWYHEAPLPIIWETSAVTHPLYQTGLTSKMLATTSVTRVRNMCILEVG